MSRYIFVADFFAGDIRRGAELANEALLFHIKDLNIECIESNKLRHIDNTKFYIISNFIGLSEQVKSHLINSKNYIIYEHDHKYISTRNPFILPTGQENSSGILNKNDMINLDFYKAAKVVLCQTNWHEKQITKNVDCVSDNIGGSPYIPEDLDLMETILNKNKTRKEKYLIFNEADFIILPDGRQMPLGDTKNKKGGLKHCIDNKLPYAFLPRINDKTRFWETLSSYTHYVFLPKIPESCSRILIEAKMLGCNIVTNTNSGAYWEPWFKLNGLELINEFRNIIIPEIIRKFKFYL